jgi:hypothetical protein
MALLLGCMSRLDCYQKVERDLGVDKIIRSRS